MMQTVIQTAMRAMFQKSVNWNTGINTSQSKKKPAKPSILHTNSPSFPIKRYETQPATEASFNTPSSSGKSELFTPKSEKSPNLGPKTSFSHQKGGSSRSLIKFKVRITSSSLTSSLSSLLYLIAVGLLHFAAAAAPKSTGHGERPRKSMGSKS